MTDLTTWLARLDADAAAAQEVADVRHYNKPTDGHVYATHIANADPDTFRALLAVVRAAVAVGQYVTNPADVSAAELRALGEAIDALGEVVG